MAVTVQFRRGTAAENNAFTGAAGELSVNTTNNSIRVHDGSTAGGHEVMKADATNISGNIAGTNISGGAIDGGTY
tara:strand:+ start:386 stop:610 length:225 start_codon:yes stop_codon:yes gene_type:complete